MIKDGYCNVEIIVYTEEGDYKSSQTRDDFVDCCICGDYCSISDSMMNDEIMVIFKKGVIESSICSECFNEKFKAKII